MFILLTSEQEIVREAQTLNQLFEEGLPMLHLRKPILDQKGYQKLLRGIQPEYYGRIVLHEYHKLCKEFGLKGIHLQEQPRIDLQEQLEDYLKMYENYTVSSSFHESEVLEACTAHFDYHLLSPVFSSISKAGYEGRGFEVNHIPKTIVGMGGINKDTIQQTFDLGYKGVGVLGGVWNTSDPVASFKEMFEVYTTIQH